MDASHGWYGTGEQELKKKLLTTVGNITVHKDSLLARSSRHFAITPMLQENICRMGQEVVYSKASELIALFGQVAVTAKQIDRVCSYYGEELHKTELNSDCSAVRKNEDSPAPGKISIPSSYCHLKSLTRPGKDLSQDNLYAMVDGSFLQCRSQDGSHKDVWKEIKVGRIFFASHQVGQVSKNRNIIRYSDYVVNLGDLKTFLTKMENRLDDYNGTLIFINDGAPWIWNWIEDAYPKAVQILDYYHAMEYLSVFAEAYITDKDERLIWIRSIEDMLNANQIEQVIQILEAFSKSSKKKTNDTEEKLKALLSYYKTHKSRMLYGTYRKKGYLVGSGPIESAHRNVIQKRLKLSGQRWTEQGARNIACLRANMKSMRNGELQKLIKAA